MLPLDKANIFQQALANLSAEKRVQWIRHKIKLGESLGVIAQHYKTTIAIIKKINDLDGNTIMVDHHLLIPIAYSGILSNYPNTFNQPLAILRYIPPSRNRKIDIVRVGDASLHVANIYATNVNEL